MGIIKSLSCWELISYPSLSSYLSALLWHKLSVSQHHTKMWKFKGKFQKLAGHPHHSYGGICFSFSSGFDSTVRPIFSPRVPPPTFLSFSVRVVQASRTPYFLLFSLLCSHLILSLSLSLPLPLFSSVFGLCEQMAKQADLFFLYRTLDLTQ